MRAVQTGYGTYGEAVRSMRAVDVLTSYITDNAPKVTRS